MNVQLPPGIDYHNPEWRWPSLKLGLDMRILFTDLYREYNMEPSPIQQAEAFHHDVYEIATRASSQEEFYRLLGERKEQRLKELRKAFDEITGELVDRPRLTNHDVDLWASITRFTQQRTLDHLVQHFATFIPEGHFEERQRVLDRHSANMARLLRRPSYKGIDANGNRVDGTNPYEKPDLPHLPLSALPQMLPKDTSVPKEHPSGPELHIPSPPRSSSGSEGQSPEHQLPTTPPPQSPPPRPAARIRDVGTQTMEGRVTKRKSAAPRRTGGAAVPRKSTRVAVAQAEGPSGGCGSRYNLRSKQGAGTTGRTRERRVAGARGRR